MGREAVDEATDEVDAKAYYDALDGIGAVEVLIDSEVEEDC